MKQVGSLSDFELLIGVFLVLICRCESAGIVIDIDGMFRCMRKTMDNLQLDLERV